MKLFSSSSACFIFQICENDLFIILEKHGAVCHLLATLRGMHINKDAGIGLDPYIIPRRRPPGSPLLYIYIHIYIYKECFKNKFQHCLSTEHKDNCQLKRWAFTRNTYFERGDMEYNIILRNLCSIHIFLYLCIVYIYIYILKNLSLSLSLYIYIKKHLFF